MSDTIVIKHRTIMHRSFQNGEYATFSPEADGDGRIPLWTVEIPDADWQNMGEPDTITVTVEPGDKLNDG